MMLLANGLRVNRTVCKLDLSNNALRSCVIKFMLDGLDDNYTLAELSLAGNFLCNEFAVDLAHLLESNPVLYKVDISKNPIGEDGAKYLLQSLL